MDRCGIYRQILALLCAALLCAAALPGFAEEPQATGGLLDDKALTEMVEGFLTERGIPAARVGIGFYFPETGEEWFYNPDTWFYPASMYKVPLMMILAERVSAGMIDPEEQIGGLPLPKLFDYIIVHSNNDYAHEVRKFLGGDEAWREEAKQYAGLPDNYYDPDYMEYCYFTPRYMTRVMETLYNDPERFPLVIDNMLEADPIHYFRLADEMQQLKVAQKYGSYSDMQGTDWNHTTGIIYTPHPFILTVMTQNVTSYEWVLGHFALLFTDYVQGLEDKIAPYQEEHEAREAQEAEQLAAEQAEAEARAKAEVERAEAQRQEELRQAEAQRQKEEREQRDRAEKRLVLILAAALASLLVLGVLTAVLIRRRRKKKRYEEYRRRFEEELRQEALEQEREIQ